MTPPVSIADLRREYALARLDEEDVSPDPIAQFARWFAEAPTHHCAMSVGHNAAAFAKVADLMGLEHVAL